MNKQKADYIEFVSNNIKKNSSGNPIDVLLEEGGVFSSFLEVEGVVEEVLEQKLKLNNLLIKNDDFVNGLFYFTYYLVYEDGSTSSEVGLHIDISYSVWLKSNRLSNLNKLIHD